MKHTLPGLWPRPAADWAVPTGTTGQRLSSLLLPLRPGQRTIRREALPNGKGKAIRTPYTKRSRSPARACTVDDVELGSKQQAQQQAPNVVRVRFFVPEFIAPDGATLALIGSHAMMGCWVSNKALPMHARDHGTWEATLELPTGCKHALEFKLVLVDADGSSQWEPGSNRLLVVDENVVCSNTVEVACVWGANAVGTGPGISSLVPHRTMPAGRPSPGLLMDPTCGPPDQVDCLLVVPMSDTPGDLVLVGNVEELGNWDPTQGVMLRRGPEGAAAAGPGGMVHVGRNTWTARVCLPVGRLIEAKLVTMVNGHPKVWETGANRTIVLLPPGCSTSPVGALAPSSSGSASSAGASSSTSTGTGSPAVVRNIHAAAVAAAAASLSASVGSFAGPYPEAASGGAHSSPNVLASEFAHSSQQQLQLTRQPAAHLQHQQQHQQYQQQHQQHQQQHTSGQFVVLLHSGVTSCSQVIHRPRLPSSQHGHPTERPAPAATSARLHFTVPSYATTSGEYLMVVGSPPELGRWDPRKGVRMEWGPGHRWTCDAAVRLPQPDAAAGAGAQDAQPAAAASGPAAAATVDAVQGTAAPLPSSACTFPQPQQAQLPPGVVEAKVVLFSHGKYIFEPGPNRRIHVAELVRSGSETGAGDAFLTCNWGLSETPAVVVPREASSEEPSPQQGGQGRPPVPVASAAEELTPALMQLLSLSLGSLLVHSSQPAAVSSPGPEAFTSPPAAAPATPAESSPSPASASTSASEAGSGQASMQPQAEHQLQAELQASHTVAALKQAVEAEHKELLRAMAAADVRISALRSQLAEAAEAHETELQDQARRQQADMAEARRLYEERILDLQVTYESRILNLQQHEARILQVQQVHEAEVASLHDQHSQAVTSLQSKLDALVQEHNTAMTALKQQQRLREADLHRQVERSRNESVERTAQLLGNLEAAEAAHADAMQRMVEQHQAELQAVDERAAMRQAELHAELEQVVQRHEVQVSDLLRRHTQAAAELQERLERGARLSEARARELQQQHETEMSGLQQRHKDEVAALESRLRNAQAQLEEAVQQHETRTAALRTQYETAVAAVELQAAHKVQELRSANERAKQINESELIRLRRDHAQTVAALERRGLALAEGIAARQLELEGLKRQLAAAHEGAQSQADALTNRLHAAEASHREELDGALSQLRVERAARSAELERLRNQLHATTVSSERTSARAHLLEAEVASAQHEAEALNNRVQQLETQLAQERESSSRQVAGMRAKLQELEQTNQQQQQQGTAGVQQLSLNNILRVFGRMPLTAASGNGNGVAGHVEEGHSAHAVEAAADGEAVAEAAAASPDGSDADAPSVVDEDQGLQAVSALEAQAEEVASQQGGEGEANTPVALDAIGAAAGSMGDTGYGLEVRATAEDGHAGAAEGPLPSGSDSEEHSV